MSFFVRLCYQMFLVFINRQFWCRNYLLVRKYYTNYLLIKTVFSCLSFVCSLVYLLVELFVDEYNEMTILMAYALVADT